MARKAAADLSPAYAARLARAEARGLSRQAARGHRAGEHVIRRMGGAKALTATQRRDAEKLAAAVKGKRGAARREAEAEANLLAANREKRRQRNERQKEREKWSGQLTDTDKKYARRIGRAWHVKLAMEPAAAAQRGLERMQRIGPEKFRAAVKANRVMYRQYIKEIDDGDYESRGEEFLDYLASDDDEPATMWYYYHSYS